jgi:hypothetical protein
MAGLVPSFFIETEGRGAGPAGPADIPMPIGIAVRSRRTIADELDGRDTKDWTAIFQAVRRDFEQQRVAITEVIYWRTYVTIVLKNRDTDPTNLPRRVGKLSCSYLYEDEMGRAAPPRARRITDPAPGRPDESSYATLQPGLRLASSHIPGGQQYMCTTAGVLVKDRVGNRFMTAASHGFPAACGTSVHHPHPQSRVIGELIMDLDQTDIALVKLKGGEDFRNVTFENVDTPAPVQLRRLIPSDDILVRSPVWLDSPDTGSIEGSHITTSYQRISEDDSLEREQVWIKATWSYMGQDACETLSDGICGSAILTSNDEALNVAGLFRYAPQSGVMLGYCCGIAADELIKRGYTLAN